MLSEFPDNGWKAGSINSLLIHKTGTLVRQPGSGRPLSIFEGTKCSIMHCLDAHLITI